jgi:predicted enzyme related to lactoylglutathione lyase
MKTKTVKEASMSKIVHTELISNDAKATADFVGKMFGWKVHQMTMPAGMEYYMWNYPDGQMGTGGGIGNTSDQPGQNLPHIGIFIDVDDLGAALAKAKSLGATQVVGETEIPDGMGYFIVISIPGGTVIGIWSQKPSK